jgi:streptogramin lyase
VPSYDALGTAPAGSELNLATYDAKDGDIWFYESNANNLAKLNPQTGAMIEYSLLPFASDPGIYQITAGPDGNIYLTEPSLNAVGMFDINTARISQFG